MDYQSLFSILPKAPSTWSTDDVLAWLHFINFHKYAGIFNEKQIDGSCLTMLDEFDLTGELAMTSKINIKKMMKWIQIGLTEYQTYIHSHVKLNLNAKMVDENPKITKKDHEELIVTSYQGNQSKFYKINEHGSLIGTHPQSDILCLEDTVANRHAQIIKKDNKFYIRDLNSKFGTFLKVNHNQPLIEGMIIQMGSFEFEICQINIENKLLRISATHSLLGKNMLVYNFDEKTTFCFGRKQTNDFNYEDQHMSGIHAKISLLNDQFYVEDMQSTNGTWIRLAKSSYENPYYLLHHETVFKVGSVSTYICKYNNPNNHQEKDFPNCMLCEEKKDCFFLPCRHNITCHNCSEKLSQCPLCQCRVQKTIKIFI